LSPSNRKIAQVACGGNQLGMQEKMFKKRMIRAIVYPKPGSNFANLTVSEWISRHVVVSKDSSI
jgi:hypothetical protein